MKRIVISVIALVLLFELFLFLTDKTTKSYKEKDRQSVYTVSLLEKEEEFKKDYQEVILGEEENSVMILMSQKELEEIKQKYKITIEKDYTGKDRFVFLEKEQSWKTFQKYYYFQFY